MSLPRRTTGRKHLVRVALSLLVTVSFFAVVEGLFWIIGGIQGFDWRVPPPMPVASERAMGVCDVSGSDTVVLCRGEPTAAALARQTPFSRTPATPRVVVMGESFVHGLSIDEGDAYPAQLGQILGEGVEVLNWGVCGSSSDELGQLGALAPSLGVDVVVLSIGNNEFGMSPYYTGWMGEHPMLYQSVADRLSGSQLYGWMRRSLRPRVPAELPNRLNAASTHRFAAEIEALHGRPIRNMSLFPMRTTRAELTAFLRDISKLDLRFFQRRIEGLIALLQREGVAVVMAPPPKDLGHSPMLSGFALPDSHEALREQLVELDRRAGGLDTHTPGSPAEVQGLIDQTLAREPRHARTLWMSGWLKVRQGQTEQGLAALAQAASEDMAGDGGPAVQAVLAELANRWDLPAVSLQGPTNARFDDRRSLFLDNVHVSPEGAQLMAQTVAPAVKAALAARGD